MWRWSLRNWASGACGPASSRCSTRRLVAPDALRRYLAKGPRGLTAAIVCRQTAGRLCRALEDAPGGPQALFCRRPGSSSRSSPCWPTISACCWRTTGPPSFETRESQAALRALIDRAARVLSHPGRPSARRAIRRHRFHGSRLPVRRCVEAPSRQCVGDCAGRGRSDSRVPPRFERRDVARGLANLCGDAARSISARSMRGRCSIFPACSNGPFKLLKDMDEFAQSRFRLEARYRHVLVDEFQDTSRAQWELVAQLVRTWGEGAGAASDALAPSIFIVGDRKQSIYGFRDADVSVLDEAAGFVSGLRDGSDPRRAIAVSFRAVPELLEFVNAVCGAVDKLPDRRDAFRYDETDRFPIGQDGQDGLQSIQPFRRSRSANQNLCFLWNPKLARRRFADRHHRRRQRHRIGRSCGRRNRPAPRRSHRARSKDRHATSRASGRHRDPLSLARCPPRVRKSARASIGGDVRLQRAGLFRRR